MNLFTNLALVGSTNLLVQASNLHPIPAADLRYTPDGVAYRSTDSEFTTEELAAMRSAPAVQPADSMEQKLAAYSNAISASDASRYLRVLESGDLERLRRMLETTIKLGK